MKFTPLEIPGVVLVEPDVFADARGFFTELYHQKKYAEGGIDRTFLQDNYSHSKKNVLRGMHYQRTNPQGKLIGVIRGKIYDVVADVRRGSPTFGRWIAEELSSENRRQLFVPEGCLHGFCVLSDEADVLYKCTTFYVPADDQGIAWNDPTLRIQWPTRDPVLSPKDAALPKLADLPESLLPRL